jgi:hypothetical protein
MSHLFLPKTTNHLPKINLTDLSNSFFFKRATHYFSSPNTINKTSRSQQWGSSAHPWLVHSSPNKHEREKCCHMCLQCHLLTSPRNPHCIQLTYFVHSILCIVFFASYSCIAFCALYSLHCILWILNWIHQPTNRTTDWPMNIV